MHVLGTGVRVGGWFLIWEDAVTGPWQNKTCVTSGGTSSRTTRVSSRTQNK